ncbi:MAG: elongation factor P [Meiothermus sp.]|nr:elongation factor P [Meiothermus sp.]
MISVTDLRNGTKVKMDGGLWACVDYQHQKIGRGGAKVVAKFRNLESGSIVERSFNSGEKLEDIYVETKDLQYLYPEGDELVLMDLETYEQFHVPRDITDASKFMREGMTVQGAMYNGRALDITPPASVELKITETPPGVRGDTVSGGTKPATLETGAVVQVPLFVETGEVIRVDTRTGAYLGRA